MGNKTYRDSFQCRMSYPYYGKDSESPYDTECRAYISVKVKRHRRIVPPSGVEESIKSPTCDKLYKSRKYNADQKYDKRVINRYQREDKKNGRHAESVDRADGTVQKASIHNLAECYRMVDNFRYPPYK